jgi:bacterial/archaeal transporter family-2 protein
VSKELAVLATVAAGGFAAVQAPANNVVSQKIGDFGAVGVNFVFGMLVLVAAFAIVGGIDVKDGVATPAWYYWILGGAAGVVIVSVGLVTVRHLGASGVTVALIGGQLALSVVMDRLGVLGLDQRSLTWEKVVGIALLALAVYLIVRE